MEPEIEVSERSVQDVNKPKYTQRGLVLSAVTCWVILNLIILIVIIGGSSHPFYFDIPEFILISLFPCILCGFIAGPLMYYAGSMLPSSTTIFRRVLYGLILAIGFVIWIFGGLLIAFGNVITIANR